MTDDLVRRERIKAWERHIAILDENQRITRNEALEEAAKVAEQHGEIVSNEYIGKACSRNIAAAIRAMKGKDDD